MNTANNNTKPFYNTTIPSDWRVENLEKLLDAKIHNGLTVEKKNIGYGGYNIIQLNDLYNAENFIDDNNLSFVNIDEQMRLLYLVQDGDILVNRVSIKKEGVGKFMLFVRSNKKDTVFESNMFQIRVGQKALPLFLLYQSRSNWVFKQLMKKAKVSNQASLSQSDLLTTKFILPPSPNNAPSPNSFPPGIPPSTKAINSLPKNNSTKNG